MKRIFTILSQKWPEYILEILVITIGIFGAFLLNNWNEERKVRNSEQVILRNLKEELIANQKELGKIIEQHSRSSRCVFQLLKYFDGGHSSVPKQTLDSLFLLAQAYYTFEPIDGYMKSIISSGKLDNLQNEKLKSMITAFEGMALDATQEVYYVNKLIQDRLWMRIDGKYSQVNGYRTLGHTEMEGYQSDYDQIFKDPIVQDILSHIGAWQDGGQEDEEKLKQHIELMVQNVDNELETD